MTDISLRPAVLADAALLLAWRNDPVSVASSLSGVMDAETNLRRLVRCMAPPNAVLVAQENGVPVGSVRLDDGELSWMVAPEHRGKGIGKAMVCRSMSLAPRFAQIKSGNVASQKVAEAAGFRLVEDGDLQVWAAPEPESLAA